MLFPVYYISFDKIKEERIFFVIILQYFDILFIIAINNNTYKLIYLFLGPHTSV